MKLKNKFFKKLLKKFHKFNCSPPYLIIYIIIILYIYILASLGSTILLTTNVYIQLSIWIITIYFAIKLQNNFILLIPIIIYLINEILYSRFNIDLYNGKSRTKTFYNMATVHFNKKEGGTENLTEGVYLTQNGSPMSIKESRHLSPVKAEEAKFIEILKDLNINHLPRQEMNKIFIVDMGCGMGGFLKYCLSRGLSGIGVTISKEQQKVLSSRGLPVILGDYRTHIPNLVGKADIITFNGTLEHVASGLACHKKTLRRQHSNWKKILKHCKQYFNPSSPYKKIFGTVLHINYNVCNTMATYLIERAYGGAYFYNMVGHRIQDVATQDGFKLLNSRDMTYHYYMASVVDENHFGVPAKLTSKRFMGMVSAIFVNPHILNMLLYGHFGCWMWQFDGKFHRNGDYYGFEPDMNKRPTTLWYWTIQQE